MLQIGDIVRYKSPTSGWVYCFVEGVDRLSSPRTYYIRTFETNDIFTLGHSSIEKVA